MAFEKKVWEDRIAEFINRRVLTKENGDVELVTVARSEGTVSAEGDAFNAETMNDLEERIEKEFSSMEKNLIDYAIIKRVKLYTETTIAGNNEGQNLYFAIPTVKGYKCILGFPGDSDNGYIIPHTGSAEPEDGGIMKLFYTNISEETVTVKNVYCNMIFIRNNN